MTLTGLRHGRAGPLLLRAEPGLQHPGAGAQQIADLVDVLVETHQHRGAPQFGLRARGEQITGAGSEPDHREAAARGTPYDRAGRHRRLPLGDEELTAVPERRRLGDGRGADGGEGMGGGVGDLDVREFRGGIRHQRHPEPPRGLDDAGLLGLGVDGGEMGHRTDRKPLQRAMDEIEDLLGQRPLRGPDTDDQGRRPQHDLPLTGLDGTIGQPDRVHTLLGDLQRGQRPHQLGLQRHGFTVQQRPGDPGDIALHGEAQGVQTGQPDGIGRRRHHGPRPQQLRHLAREFIGAAAVPADQRHGEPPALVDTDDARVGPLVPEQRRDQTHHGPRSQEAHELLALRERGPYGVRHGTLVHARTVRPRRGQPVPRSRPRRGGGNQADH